MFRTLFRIVTPTPTFNTLNLNLFKLNIVTKQPNYINKFLMKIISESLIEIFSGEYDEEYLTPTQIEYEKNMLRDLLESELEVVEDVVEEIEEDAIINKYSEFITGIIRFKEKEEYFLAIRHTQRFKIYLAETMENIAVSKKINEILQKIKEVREESRKL